MKIFIYYISSRYIGMVWAWWDGGGGGLRDGLELSHAQSHPCTMYHTHSMPGILIFLESISTSDSLLLDPIPMFCRALFWWKRSLLRGSSPPTRIKWLFPKGPVIRDIGGNGFSVGQGFFMFHPGLTSKALQCYSIGQCPGQDNFFSGFLG